VAGFISTDLERMNKVRYLNGESFSNSAESTWLT
jgi:hypothetical protein